MPEIPDDILTAIDALIDYAADDEIDHYRESVQSGGDPQFHIYVSLRKVMAWRGRDMTELPDPDHIPPEWLEGDTPGAGR